ncbi:hypothetical protein [Polyangium sp. 6x1]|uniref:hypothetical protein n=1 Tax=Polyangium sp. 6x1 TaxID=3042689 RepID=UPI002482A55B|nr:hypothetical protein [Polyangium sp. 6x1]MDI1444356.1 hypothetical protein [Polyangium sp. 6x1]
MDDELLSSEALALETLDSQILGTKCTIKPSRLRTTEGRSPCMTNRTELSCLIPWLTGVDCKKAAIADCRTANALEYGHRASPPGSCYDECERRVLCIPFAPL